MLGEIISIGVFYNAWTWNEPVLSPLNPRGPGLPVAALWPFSTRLTPSQIHQVSRGGVLIYPCRRGLNLDKNNSEVAAARVIRVNNLASIPTTIFFLYTVHGDRTSLHLAIALLSNTMNNIVYSYNHKKQIKNTNKSFLVNL